MKQGNYPLLFRLFPLMLFALLIHNFSLILLDFNGKGQLFIFRIFTIAILILICSLHRLKKTFIQKYIGSGSEVYKKTVLNDILIYETVIGFCLPFCQTIPLVGHMSIWHLYCAVIIGGLFYGLFSGYFLIPVLVSPIMYYLATIFASIIFHKSISVEFTNIAGILIVMWFSAIASSAARIGFDVFYFLRVAFHEQNITLEGLKKLNETAVQKMRLEKEIDKFKSVETLGLYAGGIAHDFNNMLTVIAGQMMFLGRNEHDDIGKKSIENIMLAVRKTSELIKKMLLFTGRYDNRARLFSMNEALLSITDLLITGAGKKIEIERSIPKDKVDVFGDEYLFQTSLIGFLVFIIQNSRRKNRIAIRMDSVSEFKTIPANDNPEILSEKSIIIAIRFMFSGDQSWKDIEPFIELVRIINNMKGKLVTGKAEEFEYIQLSIPVKNESNANGNRTYDGSKKVLIIDDDKMVLKLTKEILGEAGYSVITCNNPDEAIVNYKDNFQEVGLVILDMLMPDKSGKEIYFELKKVNPEVKVIIVSGYCSEIDLQEMINEGVLGYIEKPYTEEELYSKVARAIGN